MQHAVHQGQAPGGSHQLHAHEGLFFLELLLLSAEVEQVVRALAYVAVGGNQKTGRARGWILDHLTGLRLHHINDGVDEWAGGEVLAGAALGFGSVLFQQALVQIAQPVAAAVEPLDAVQIGDERLQVSGLLDAALRVGINGGNAFFLAAGKPQQHLPVCVPQFSAIQFQQPVPSGIFGQQYILLLPFVIHLQEQE